MPASPEVRDPTRADADPSPSALLEGTGVTKRYGRLTVLDGADFAVQAGVTGLLGANGSGKTTLLSLLLGMQRPQAGAIRVLGLDPSSSGPEVRARIGYTPEHHQLPTDFGAHDFVQHIAEIHGLPKREATSRASDALWWVGLGEERYRPLGTLSVGQRQRVKLAMAIAHDPLLVLLDEPTDGLDPVQRESMLELIRRVGHDFGISVLLSSHLLDEVERTCDRILMLAGGRVALGGDLSELRGSSRGVRVELDADAAVVADRLRDAGCEVLVEGGRLSVESADLPPAAVMRIVRDAVADAGLGIRRLQHQVVDLEDVFLEADR